MRGIFGRKKITVPSQSAPSWDNSFSQVKGGAIGVLIISRSAADNTDLKMFTAVSDFAGSIQILDRKFKKETEVGDCLISLYNVDQYNGEVLNGGHGQYIENTKLRGHIAESCRDGLAIVQAADYLAIYDRLLELSKEKDQKINFASGAFDPTPEMTALDKLFYPLFFKSDPISGYVKRYVLAQPWCVIVEDADYEPAVERVWSQAQLT